MALPDLTALTRRLARYLDVQDTAEDTLLSEILTSAQAWLAAELGRPLTAAEGETTSTLTTTTTGFPAIRSLRGFRGSSSVSSGAAVSAAVTLTTTTTVTPLDQLPDYAAVVEPLLSQAVIDVAADLYQRRSPAARGESEAGASADYDTAITLPRSAARLVALYGIR